jgi:hypothetical protein
MKYKFNMITIGANAEDGETAKQMLELLEEGGEIINTVSFAAGSRYIVKTPIKKG